MNDRITRTEELRSELRELRQVLPETSDTEDYLGLFEEFVCECEFDLALHNVCDYLLEPGTPSVAMETIVRIQALHATLEVQDDCVERLKAKGQLTMQVRKSRNTSTC